MSTLVVGEINPFVAAIANRLDDVKLLGSTTPDSNKAWLNDSLKIFYGSPDNEDLVARILDEEEVIFNFMNFMRLIFR